MPIATNRNDRTYPTLRDATPVASRERGDVTARPLAVRSEGWEAVGCSEKNRLPQGQAGG